MDVLDLTVFVVRVFAESYAKHPHLYDPKEINERFQMPVSEVVSKWTSSLRIITPSIQLAIANN